MIDLDTMVTMFQILWIGCGVLATIIVLTVHAETK